MKKMVLISLIIFNLTFVFGHEKTKPDIRLVFYNVENFYDWQNDPLTNDEEFLPEGNRKWSKFRFGDKASNIYKVFTAVGETEFPDIIGMAEVENAFVLNYLIRETPLKKVPLGIVHNESPDPRGIDACILYRTDKLKLLSSDFIRIVNKNGEVQNTREIVYASFQTKGNGVLHVFVNHWPSRRGGEMASQQKRYLVASILRQKVDSIQKLDKSANIVITGDFNDEPFNNSITKVLKAVAPGNEIVSSNLYNLSTQFVKKYGVGTLKYKGNWSVFDQIIVTGSLLGKNYLTTCSSCAGVFNNKFILTDDKTHMGFMPWRTYNGFNYSGGYSDHLPVYLNLYLNKP